MARLFRRLQDLFAANLDELLDRETTREQLLRQVNEGLSSTRDALRDAQHSQQSLLQVLHQHRQQVQRWRTRAVQALRLDDEALAREALTCQRDTEALVALLEQAQQLAQQTGERLQQQQHTLEQHLVTARRYSPNDFDEASQGSAYEFLGRMGARLADMGANLGRHPEPREELAKTFKNIEQEAHIESQLAALRQELDGS